MAFSLKKLFKKAKRAVVPAITGFISGGPVGAAAAAAGSLLGGSLAGGRPASSPAAFGQSAFTGRGGPAAFPTPFVGGPSFGMTGAGMGSIGRVGRFGASIVRQILDRASANAGRRVTSGMLLEATRVCGLATTAASFGISEVEVCQVIVARRRRRPRGISAADLRRTRSTLRKLSTVQRQVKEIARPLIGRR